MTYIEARECIQEDECTDCYAPIEECKKCEVGLALEALAKMEHKCENCEHSRSIDIDAYWCFVNHTAVYDNMSCTDWSDEE